MPHNVPGSPKPNGQAGLAITGQTPGGLEVGTPREVNTAAAAKQQVPGVPKFDDDPVGAISFALREVGAALQGNELPSERAKAQAFQQQGFQLQKDAHTLKAIKFGIEQFEAFPDGDKSALVSTISKMSPEAGAVLKAISKQATEKSRVLLDFIEKNPEMVPGFSKLSKLIGAEGAIEVYGDAAAKVVEREALAPSEVDLAGKKAAAVAAATPDKPDVRKGIGGAGFDIKTGEVVTPGTYNAIDTTTGSQVTIPIRTKAEADDLLDRLDSGDLVKGSVQRTKQIEDVNGAILILFPDLPSTLTAEQARAAGINIDLSDATFEGLLESHGEVTQLSNKFTELQGIITKTPAAVGTAGFIARVGDSLLAQLPLIAQLTGIEFDPKLLLSENYESTFREIGIESHRLKSATIGAAYALALAQRQRGGRMAQQDIERGIVQISGQDPAATLQILQDLKVRTAEGFQTRVTNLVGKRPPGIEVTPSPALPKKETSALLEFHDPSEVNLLSPGTHYIWLPDGKEYVRE